MGRRAADNSSRWCDNLSCSAGRKAATKKIAKNIKFEDALSELEAQVQLLESGELPLDKALEVFKYGVELSRVCSSRLETVKQEVDKIVVTDSNDVGYKLETFQDLEVK